MRRKTENVAGEQHVWTEKKCAPLRLRKKAYKQLSPTGGRGHRKNPESEAGFEGEKLKPFVVGKSTEKTQYLGIAQGEEA